MNVLSMLRTLYMDNYELKSTCTVTFIKMRLVVDNSTGVMVSDAAY